MKLPIRQIAGNILWTVDGAVWAVYRVSPGGDAHATASARRELLDATTAVIKNLPGEALLAGLCPQLDPADVVRAMIDGVDLDTHPEWAETCDAVLDQLEELDLTGRTFWLSVPLSAAGRTSRLAARAADTQLRTRLGGHVPPASTEEIAARQRQARELLDTLPGGVSIRPAQESELVWWLARAPRRGLDEPLLRDGQVQDAGLRRRRGTGRGVLAALEEVILDESGKTDDLVDPQQHHPDHDRSSDDRPKRPDRPSWRRQGQDREDGDPTPGHQERAGRRGRGPLSAQLRYALRYVTGPLVALRRRYVKVITEHGDSYQAFLTLAQMPRQFRFPGSEWLSRLDEFGYPIDWVARLRIVPNDVAKAKARKQARELATQWNDQDDDDLGAPAELREATAELDDQRSRLAASTTEVEVQASVVFCVWADEPDTANARAEAFRKTFASSEYEIVRPLGDQTALYLSMLPGAPTSRVLGDYTQYLLARDFAMAMPWLSAEVGDPTGGLLGFSLDGSGLRPVLYDPSYGPRIKASASAAVCGELGAGKSVFLKRTWFDIRARLGGRVIAVDRTPRREYVRFAGACPGRTHVVEVSEDASYSLDPLRIFAGRAAVRHAESFFGRWLDLAPMDPPGVVLAEALQAVAARDHASSQTLLFELDLRGERDPAALELARRLRLLAGKDLARLVFDPTLPPLDVAGADSIVFATSNIPMPTREELASEYSTRRLSFAKSFGRAVHVLIAAICREWAFADDRQFVGVFWDECYSATSSPEGAELVLELVRDGRKHNAGAYLGGHDPDDFGNQTIRGLIPVRLLGRHRDSVLAGKALRWMDLDDEDPELLELVTGNLSPLNLPAAQAAARRGEFLFRDARRRVGTVKVLIPPYGDIPEAILTDPAVAGATRRDPDAGARPGPAGAPRVAEPAPVSAVPR